MEDWRIVSLPMPQLQVEEEDNIIRCQVVIALRTTAALLVGVVVIEYLNRMKHAVRQGQLDYISFLSGMLFWLNSMLAVTLYTKRDELLSGGAASGGQYEEIDPNGVGFAGDFPSSQGMRTMQV